MPVPAGPDFAETRPYMDLAEKLGILHACLAPAPIRRVELEVRGESVDRLVRPVAAALLKGILTKSFSDDPVNYINAPVLAEEHGITISQAKGMGPHDYPNLLSARVYWNEGQRLLAGVLFGDATPRIVQVDDYHLEANPDGVILIMQNRDVPGVIGQVGTVLATYNINIGEWRMGRHQPGGEALSFINLDSEPPTPVLQALEKVPAVTYVTLVNL
jgi:D-3-phosphoglycerate dehydrogenase